MSWFKKLKDKIVNITNFAFMSFNERNLIENVNKMHKLNEDFHNTLYAELVDIDRIANIKKGYVDSLGFEETKVKVSFCGQLLDLPVESDDDFLERKIAKAFNESLKDSVDSVWQKSNDDLKDFLVGRSIGKKYLDAEIHSFEINGEKFGLDQLERFRRIPSVITSHPNISDVAWKDPKYVWEHEEKCKRDQEAILKIIND